MELAKHVLLRLVTFELDAERFKVSEFSPPVQPNSAASMNSHTETVSSIIGDCAPDPRKAALLLHASVGDSMQVQKEAVSREYANLRYEQPYQTAIYHSSILLEHKRWHFTEYEAVAPTLHLSDLSVSPCCPLFFSAAVVMGSKFLYSRDPQNQGTLLLPAISIHFKREHCVAALLAGYLWSLQGCTGVPKAGQNGEMMLCHYLYALWG